MPMNDASASDNCSDVSITVSETLAGNAAATTIVRVHCDDACGNNTCEPDDHC